MRAITKNSGNNLKRNKYLRGKTMFSFNCLFLVKIENSANKMDFSGTVNYQIL